MLRQLNSEVECLKRKLINLKDAIETKSISQIEIEYSNVIDNFEYVVNEVDAANKEIGEIEETIFNTSLSVNINISAGGNK